MVSPLSNKCDLLRAVLKRAKKERGDGVLAIQLCPGFLVFALLNHLIRAIVFV